MDLDHVCVLHKRWFRNLRIIKQRRDYVEYRLHSFFYGLKQDILVRGAPIDQDHYWYEFLTSLAQIRVEGAMEGPDGDLLLTETIIYKFHWLLAPLFWMLSPLFQKQKEDILFADSSLLERVYQLDKSGFKRYEMDKPRVVVYGGSGYFGRLLVEDLLEHSDANVIIASRNPGRLDFNRFESRVKFVISDINDCDSVAATIEGAKVAIGCVGPFQGLTLNLLRACIEKKVHYIDVADDRDFMERCHSLSDQIERAGIMAFVGCSVVPGISSLLTKFCQDEISNIEKTRIFITPGTRHPRGPGSFLCLLSTVGEPYSILVDGNRMMVKGWSRRERVEFPSPLGTRHVYFVVDIADYFLQPLYFKTQTVEFKIGSELDFLNRSLAVLRWVKQSLGFKRLDGLMPLARMIIYLASWFGTSQGAVMVEVTGGKAADSQKISLSVYTERRGEIIPTVLASIAAQMIICAEVAYSGILPLPDAIPRDRFMTELSKRNIKFAVKGPDLQEWIRCSAKRSVRPKSSV